MAQQEKAALWGELKDAGVQFKKHYREYNTDQLRDAVTQLRAGRAAKAAAQSPAMAQPEAPQAPSRAPLPVAPPDELAGVRINTHSEEQPIRTDENGLIWYQDEVRKPAYPKPRGRRVMKYHDPGFKRVTVKSGDYLESFEMPGDENRVSEVKITLPSYQVGIYVDPRYPQFKIHVYNETRGFDLFSVQRFYGGPDLVPVEIKKMYVENSLCYDIRTTVRAIEKEYRERVLGKVSPE